MKKTIVLFLIVCAYGFASKPTNMPFPSQQQAEYDLKKCCSCNLDEHSIDEIIKFYPKDPNSKQHFYVDNYCLVFVRIPSGDGGCSFNESIVLIYVKNNNTWMFRGVSAALYELEQINKMNIFKSEVDCIQLNSEERYFSRVFVFKGEKLQFIDEIGGIDRSLYYTNLLAGSKMYARKVPGSDIYDDALKIFTSAIGDTICDYSVFKDFKFIRNQLESYSIERKIQILKGGKNTREDEDSKLDVVEKIVVRKVKM